MDEPFWTALALISLGVLEMTEGRYDDASGHLREVMDLAERAGNARLAASAHLNLGRLALVRDRLDEATELLEEGLDLSRAMRRTRNVSLALSAFGALASARGEPERAALLAGAAEGVRRRAGLRPWPLLPQESDRLEQVRQALGAGRFEELFAAGTRLSQREAVAAVKADAAST
jgi:tetratricopeptide (TPR) repeat protein